MTRSQGRASRSLSGSAARAARTAPRFPAPRVARRRTSTTRPRRVIRASGRRAISTPPAAARNVRQMPGRSAPAVSAAGRCGSQAVAAWVAAAWPTGSAPPTRNAGRGPFSTATSPSPCWSPASRPVNGGGHVGDTAVGRPTKSGMMLAGRESRSEQTSGRSSASEAKPSRAARSTAAKCSGRCARGPRTMRVRSPSGSPSPSRSSSRAPMVKSVSSCKVERIRVVRRARHGPGAGPAHRAASHPGY
jgi:hypothetical protein